MRKLFYVLTFSFFTLWVNAQESRINTIKNNLEVLAVDYPAFNETLKLEVNVSNVSLPNFLMAVSKVHQLNLSVGQDISNITVVNNFSNVTITDLLVFLCKEYDLTIDFTGSILAIKKYIRPSEIPKEKEITIEFDAPNSLISIDVVNDSLDKVFRKIMEVSGRNLLYSNNIKNHPLNVVMNNVPFDIAMEKMANVNNLDYSKSRDGFYLFTSADQNQMNGVLKGIPSGANYVVLDTVNKILDVEFNNAVIADVISALSYDLQLDVYTATPLEQAGNVTFKAKNIHYDDLLTHIFESQENGQLSSFSGNEIQNTERQRPNIVQTNRNRIASKAFTFKKENNIYFFGTANQLSLRKIEIIQMMHRSIELLSSPQGRRRTAGRTDPGRVNFFSNGGNSGGFGNSNNLNSQRTIRTQESSFTDFQNNAEALVSILPEELKSELDIKVDFELNSFFVSGPASNIKRFKDFINKIDQPVPVILIEVMIIEVRKTATVETGISWGIGNEPVKTTGNLFPNTDITLGAKTINRIIGGFDGFGSFNIGRVVPDFFAQIKALEENGNLKIRSTPKLSTLNGHRANLSIGETTYYVVTNQNFFGSQIPTASEVRNFAPIDAELAISIKPLVSGDGQVTLDINVIQSDFSGERIEEDAPPGLTSREFSSIIRMQNQDLAILGGLEEKIKNDTGSGVPLLARIPVIKWLFSRRSREDTKQKLTILVKPTVIY